MRTYRFVLKLYGWIVVVSIAYLVIMAGSIEEVEVDWVPDTRYDHLHSLIGSYECWTGPAPLNHDGQPVIPGHAVVDLGSGPEYVASDIGFGIYLDGDPGTLYAFCP